MYVIEELLNMASTNSFGQKKKKKRERQERFDFARHETLDVSLEHWHQRESTQVAQIRYALVIPKC